MAFGCAFGSNFSDATLLLPQEETSEKIIPIDSVMIQGFGDKLLTAFYINNDNKTVWIEKTPTRKFLLSTLNICSDDGLDPQQFALDKLNLYEAAINTLADSKLVEYDILLTVKLQQYITQMSNGRLNPKVLYRDWDLKENKTDINRTLSGFATGDSLYEKVERLKPNHPMYKSLKKALQVINTYPDDTIKCIEIQKIISKNTLDAALIPIKQRLMYWKYLIDTTSVNEMYDDQTQKAIKKFQLHHGLYVDGVIGYRTVEALNFFKSRRREQILVNLERWKWFPRDLGRHYIILNIPDYNLYVVKNSDTIDTRRVVVGVLTRKTAVLSSTFNTIILNPTWTVPPTILEEDLLPAATKKRGYFASKNITIYDKKNNIVSAWHWNPEKYKNYRYVQTPGDNNSLGNVKFNFINRYSVYLHDTNHRDYFSKSSRSLSSGCVRVENPLPLAQYMLQDRYWTMERICEVIATKKTTTIPLKEKIDIHQLYWTAWMNRDGNMEFRQDIYNLDDELYEKLRN